MAHGLLDQDRVLALCQPYGDVPMEEVVLGETFRRSGPRYGVAERSA